MLHQRKTPQRCYSLHRSRNSATVCIGYCMTYEEGNGTFLVECPYFDYHTFNVNNLGYIQLPEYLSELSRSMCDHLNRESRVCSQRKEGYALAVNSYDYDCVKCSDKWQGVIFYVLIKFVPVTIFYIHCGFSISCVFDVSPNDLLYYVQSTDGVCHAYSKN